MPTRKTTSRSCIRSVVTLLWQSNAVVRKMRGAKVKNVIAIWLKNAHDLVYSHDLDGNYTSVNNACERDSGYTREECLKLNLTQVVAPEDLARVRWALGTKSMGKASSAYELNIIAKDGRKVTLEVHSRLMQRDGIPYAVHGIARS